MWMRYDGGDIDIKMMDVSMALAVYACLPPSLMNGKHNNT